MVVNTDYGDAGSMPFDIAHHRLATYSLKDNSKGEVKKKLKEIIVGTVENILENGKRVRPQFSNIQLGSYDKSTKEICKRIIPYVLKNESEYINAKQQQEIYQNRYILCQQSVMFSLWISEFGYKRFVGEDMDMSEMWSET